MGAVGGWIDGHVNAAVTLKKTWVELIGSLTDYHGGGLGPRFYSWRNSPVRGSLPT